MIRTQLAIGTLRASNFASATGRTVARAELYQGVPGRKGNVTLLAASAAATVTPTAGEHFYYAKLTQDDGNILWSAPVWVTQSAGTADTLAPTVSVSETGASGTITLSAIASDNVGVSRVEFYVDKLLKGTDTSAPYSMTLDSTTLANAGHALTAKAYDAANNVGTASAVNFTVNNVTSTELMVNGGFEGGTGSWTASSGVITSSASVPAHGGSAKAKLNGYGSAHTDTLYQQITIPSSATSAILSFWLMVKSDETTTTQAYDTMKVQVRNSGNTVLATLATYSNLNKSSSYAKQTFDLSAYKGQTVRVYFLGVEGSRVATSFLVDDVSLMAK